MYIIEGDKMKWYPIKQNFVSVFRDKEEVLEYLIGRNSAQLLEICEKIDYADFYCRCISFYNKEDYVLHDKTIIYTNPLTKQTSCCFLSEYCITLSNVQGFEQFLYRYFKTYFTLNGKTCCGKWKSYENTY